MEFPCSKGISTWVLSLLLSCTLWAQDAPPSKGSYRDPGTMEALNNTRRLKVGDNLFFRVVEDRDPAYELVVTGTGEVEFPYIGKVHAVGKTPMELAKMIKPTLEKDYYYTATVLITPGEQSGQGKIYLAGQVVNPTPQEIPINEVLTASKAVMNAGGPTEIADLKNARVTRKIAGGGTKVIGVNLEAILREGRVELDPPLEPDDVVIVPESAGRGRVQVTGKVRSPGYVEILPADKLTVSGAIIKSSGFNEFAEDKKVQLTRPLPGGRKETHVINVKRALERGGGSDDIEVRPGDQIHVGQRFINF